MTLKFFKILAEILIAIATVICVILVVINFVAFNDKSIEISIAYINGREISSIDALVLFFTILLDLSWISFIAKR